MMYHTTTWLLWLLATLPPVMLTKNPFYLTILLLAVAVDYGTIGRSSLAASSWSVFLKTGLVLAAFSALLNPLTVHYGETILFTLPRATLKAGGAVFLELGGRITLEALSYGLTNGLSLMAILLVFATFNALVNHHKLLRSIPAFMYQTGAVTSIAIAFVPQMAASLQEIREAQMIRGHRFRGIRDLLPLFMPLLTSSLERAIQLAESMEARGFGGSISQTDRQREPIRKLSIALALLAILIGASWYGYFSASRWVGGLLAMGGVLLLGWILRAMGQQVERSRYRHELWRRQDTFVSATSLLSLAVFAFLLLLDKKALAFYPYPRFELPTFNPIIGLALLAPVAPVLGFPGRIERMRKP
ncbi:MAG TPA: energy-coupling factor transporter transmembrane protein EcfT [Anaerolineae bacterium]|nr:energy-coupling factor transporter transmembrane protein EcfT [Anaerolineae bacterium]